jgi:cell division protein FtsL
MEKQNWNRTNHIKNIALALVAVIAIAGITIAYVQYDKMQVYIEKTDADKVAQDKLVMESYDRIEANLAKITEHEAMIKQDMAGSESTSNLAPEERIQYEIQMIEQLINENNRIIAGLNEQISEKDSRLAGYERTVKDLKAKVTEYHAMVDQLVADKEALQKNLVETAAARDNLQVEVTNLNGEIVQQTSVIAEKDQLLLEKEKNLHTAYWTIGTYKTLRDRNIVDKEGGFLGMNTVKTLGDNLDPDKFKEIDWRNVSEIPVGAKNCEVITDQDPSTYTLLYADDKVSSIKITDPAKFWGKSKYLVVVVRENNFDEVAASR